MKGTVFKCIIFAQKKSFQIQKTRQLLFTMRKKDSGYLHT